MLQHRLRQEPTVTIQLPDLLKKARVNTTRTYKAAKNMSKVNVDLLPIPRNIRKDSQNYLFPKYV